VDFSIAFQSDCFTQDYVVYFALDRNSPARMISINLNPPIFRFNLRTAMGVLRHKFTKSSDYSPIVRFI